MARKTTTATKTKAAPVTAPKATVTKAAAPTPAGDAKTVTLTPVPKEAPASKPKAAAVEPPKAAPVKAAKSKSAKAEKAETVEQTGEVKKPEFLDRAVLRSGVKRRDAKPAIEAAMEEIAEILLKGEALSLPPLGKIKVVKSKDVGEGAKALTLKLRTMKKP